YARICSFVNTWSMAGRCEMSRNLGTPLAPIRNRPTSTVSVQPIMRLVFVGMFAVRCDVQMLVKEADSCLMNEEKRRAFSLLSERYFIAIGCYAQPEC